MMLRQAILRQAILRQTLAAACSAALLVLPAPHGARAQTAAAQTATADDTARFLAGMEPQASSPLSKFTKDTGWRQHAAFFDNTWRQLDSRQLTKIRSWSQTNLKDRRGTLFYMFSGPDFLYANAFFPNASTYVMSGLEPVGRIPDINDRSRNALSNIRAALASSLTYSFFITKNMKSQLAGSELTGTLPIIYVFAARSGKTIRDVSLISLDQNGVVQPGSQSNNPGFVPGAKIILSGADGTPQTLYYFRTDVSDSGLRNSGFLKFCETLGNGDGLLKSASYLMHSGSFTKVREFVMERSQNIVQDDSGIPAVYLKEADWRLVPFGRYLGPISIFPGRQQARLQDLFARGRPEPLTFGIGYRWRSNESNLLLAVRKAALPDRTPPVVTPAPAPTQVEKPQPEKTPTSADAAPTQPPVEEVKVPLGSPPPTEAVPGKAAPEADKPTGSQAPDLKGSTQ